MTFSEHAFDACCREAKELGRRLTKTEWLETMQDAYDTYPHQGLIATDGSKPAKGSRIKTVDAAWLEELEQNPAYAGIDIKRELGKAQAWASIRAHILAGGSPKEFAMGEGRHSTMANKMLPGMGLKKVFITEEEHELIIKLRKESAA
jgi:hypothetical protein